MKKYKVCIIGAGNISNTRHIPALKAIGSANIVGVIGISEKNVLRTKQKHSISNNFVLDKSKSYLEQLSSLEWFKEVEAVVVGVPPQEHYEIAKSCLLLNKHVLIEKPMVMNREQADDLIKVSSENKCVLNVMHNFQYADNFMRMETRLRNGEFGEILSFFEFQCTNRDRRLPEWYNDLPLGLFYDEAAHFLYLLERLGGEIEILNAHAHFGKDNENTPMLLTTSMTAGKYPVTLYINFNAPVCEWALVISCEKNLIIYDFFRDITIVIPNDGQHLAMNVLTTSWKFTIQHWWGTFINGVKMVSGKLLYGHDVVIKNFLNAIDTGIVDKYIDSKSGYKNISAMNTIVEKVLNK